MRFMSEGRERHIGDNGSVVDGERDMTPNAGCGLRPDKVAGREKGTRTFS